MKELSGEIKALAEAQDRRMKEFSEEMKRMNLGWRRTDSEVGGIGRTLSYALENEAYRNLPAFLETRHGIKVTKRFIRCEVAGEEINLFAEAMWKGKKVFLVGESKTRMDEGRGQGRAKNRVFAQIEEKVRAVREAYPETEIVPLLIAHYVTPGVLKQAEQEGVIVVQSFE